MKPIPAAVASQAAAGVVWGGLEAVDLSALTEQEKTDVFILLPKYQSVFADLGIGVVPI